MKLRSSIGCRYKVDGTRYYVWRVIVGKVQYTEGCALTRPAAHTAIWTVRNALTFHKTASLSSV